MEDVRPGSIDRIKMHITKTVMKNITREADKRGIPKKSKDPPPLIDIKQEPGTTG